MLQTAHKIMIVYYDR